MAENPHRGGPSNSSSLLLGLSNAPAPNSSSTKTEPQEYEFKAVNLQQAYRSSRPFITSKDWTVEKLLELGPRFRHVPRISALQSPEKLQAAIDEHEKNGVPLVIEGFHKHSEWPKDIFDVDWLLEYGQQDISVRNVHDWSDRVITVKDFINKSRAQPTATTPDETERLYGKDAQCPDEWTEWLEHSGVLPSSLLRYGPSDLLKHLPKTDDVDAVETLMCYLGVGDTFTPCHKDLCASSGQNIMCYTENEGSSFWFMTESSAAPAVSDYFHQLQEELDLETHITTVEELAKGPFVVYITEQKLGDMVLVPPRSCHQVVNHGGITVKSSWSRMILRGLKAALYHELPIYRRVCRKEIYRVKSTIYHTLLRYTTDLKHTRKNLPKDSSTRVIYKQQLKEDLRQLLEMFDDILVEEYCEEQASMKHIRSVVVEKNPQDDEHVECDFCGADVFQSFFECSSCIPGTVASKKPASEGGLVLCSSCYAEGRTCKCGEMKPMQYRPFSELLRDRNRAAEMLDGLRTETDDQDNLAMWDEKYIRRNLLSDTRVGIFQAAYTLSRNRQRENSIAARSCTIRTTIQSHIVPAIHCIRCKPCHTRKCFSHILEFHAIHSAEAILVDKTDLTGKDWHERHVASKAIVESVHWNSSNAGKEGSRPNIRSHLAKMATVFITCKPISTLFTVPGWYDKNRQTVEIPNVAHATEAITHHYAYHLDSPLSSLTSLSDHEELLPDSPVSSDLSPPPDPIPPSGLFDSSSLPSLTDLPSSPTTSSALVGPFNSSNNPELHARRSPYAKQTENSVRSRTANSAAPIAPPRPKRTVKSGGGSRKSTVAQETPPNSHEEGKEHGAKIVQEIQQRKRKSPHPSKLKTPTPMVAKKPRFSTSPLSDRESLDGDGSGHEPQAKKTRISSSIQLGRRKRDRKSLAGNSTQQKMRLDNSDVVPSDSGRVASSSGLSISIPPRKERARASHTHGDTQVSLPKNPQRPTPSVSLIQSTAPIPPIPTARDDEVAALRKNNILLAKQVKSLEEQLAKQTDRSNQVERQLKLLREKHEGLANTLRELRPTLEERKRTVENKMLPDPRSKDEMTSDITRWRSEVYSETHNRSGPSNAAGFAEGFSAHRMPQNQISEQQLRLPSSTWQSADRQNNNRFGSISPVKSLGTGLTPKRSGHGSEQSRGYEPPEHRNNDYNNSEGERRARAGWHGQNRHRPPNYGSNFDKRERPDVSNFSPRRNSTARRSEQIDSHPYPSREIKDRADFRDRVSSWPPIERSWEYKGPDVPSAQHPSSTECRGNEKSRGLPDLLSQQRSPDYGQYSKERGRPRMGYYPQRSPRPGYDRRERRSRSPVTFPTRRDSRSPNFR